LVLAFGVSENHQPDHVVHWARGGLRLSLGSLNDWEDQVYVHSAEMVGQAFQETMLEVAHGREG